MTDPSPTGVGGGESEGTSGKGPVNNSSLAWIHGCITAIREGMPHWPTKFLLMERKYFIMMSSFLKVVCSGLSLQDRNAVLALVIHQTIPLPPLVLEGSGWKPTYSNSSRYANATIANRFPITSEGLHTVVAYSRLLCYVNQ